MKIPGLWRLKRFLKEPTREFSRTKEEVSYYLKNKNKKVERGINLVGNARGDFGMGEHVRLVTNAISTTSVKFCVNSLDDWANHSLTNGEVERFFSEASAYQINLFCFNARPTIDYMKTYKGTIAVKKHYNIGYGYWELSKYPKSWNEQDNYLQEIWAPSRYIQGMLENATKLPVHYMPVPIDFAMPVGYTRKTFNLPEDSFLFLFTYAVTGYAQRKNPEGVIRAFQKAFPIEKNDKVSLVVKVNRNRMSKGLLAQVEALQARVAYDKRIILIDEVLDRASILGLISVCNSYVSLHLAEGLGFGMAEAMKMKKVVIATNFSGNLDFMNHENSCLVNYKLEEVKKDEHVLVEEGSMWAKPDEEHAAFFMRKVYEEPEFVEKLGKAAKEYIDTHHNFKTIGELYQKRINEISATTELL